MGIFKNLLVLGSAKFVNVIKGTVEHAQNGIYFGHCATAAATADKVVILDDPTGFTLRNGVMICVTFDSTNSASNVTLNVEGTGAKAISNVEGTAYTGTSTTITGHMSYYSYYVYNGTYWCFVNYSLNSNNNSNTVPSAQCETAAGTAAKAATCSNYSLKANSYLHVNIRYANTAANALTFNVNSTGAKPIYINGSASSASNYTLPAGSYLAFYDGTNWIFRTDGVMPGTNVKAESLQSSIDSINNKMPALLLNANVTSTASTHSMTTMNNFSLFLIEYVAGASNDVFLNSILVSLDSLKSPTGFVIQNKGVGDNLIESDSVHIKYTSGTSFSISTTSGASNRYVRITGLL